MLRSSVFLKSAASHQTVSAFISSVPSLPPGILLPTRLQAIVRAQAGFYCFSDFDIFSVGFHRSMVSDGTASVNVFEDVCVLRAMISGCFFSLPRTFAPEGVSCLLLSICRTSSCFSGDMQASPLKLGLPPSLPTSETPSCQSPATPNGPPKVTP